VFSAYRLKKTKVPCASHASKEQSRLGTLPVRLIAYLFTFLDMDQVSTSWFVCQSLRAGVTHFLSQLRHFVWTHQLSSVASTNALQALIATYCWNLRTIRVDAEDNREWPDKDSDPWLRWLCHVIEHNAGSLQHCRLPAPLGLGRPILSALNKCTVLTEFRIRLEENEIVTGFDWSLVRPIIDHNRATLRSFAHPGGPPFEVLQTLSSISELSGGTCSSNYCCRSKPELYGVRGLQVRQINGI